MPSDSANMELETPASSVVSGVASPPRQQPRSLRARAIRSQERRRPAHRSAGSNRAECCRILPKHPPCSLRGGRGLLILLHLPQLLRKLLLLALDARHELLVLKRVLLLLHFNTLDGVLQKLIKAILREEFDLVVAQILV